MRQIFCTFFILFVVFGGSADGFAIGDFLNDLWEDSDENPAVDGHQPAVKNRTSSSQGTEQRENKTSHDDNIQENHQNDVDYAGNIFEKLLSEKLIDELVDTLADCIDDTGIFDFLDSSEEEIDSNVNGTQGNKKPKDNFTNIMDLTKKKGSTEDTKTSVTATMPVQDKNSDNRLKKNVTIGIH